MEKRKLEKRKDSLTELREKVKMKITFNNELNYLMSDNENNRDINESVFKSLLCFDEKN